ncbi:hypothetical protein [Williamwhitmania taraxaci]|uniref:Uncharacterized protein n=1 Tax=Williamwhitmania taraxaci TaxID=1640674 RepID=A0A1G6PJV8_9BACT|nr:hypothetical protein [Williamwhitmania taraxaci]SDC80271.1 hypothetical protein SAMN05216323_105221 [Williamwhitmania taraxaci]
MKKLKIVEMGRLSDVVLLSDIDMTKVSGGQEDMAYCACDARFAMSSGTIQIGGCICHKKYS